MRLSINASLVMFAAVLSIEACALPEEDLVMSGPDGSHDGAVRDARADGSSDAARADRVVPVSDGSSPFGDAARADAAPGTEICNDGLDNNGDGVIDENCPCEPGTTQPCFPGDAALAGHGACHRGTQSCTTGAELGHWSACTGAGAPSPEVCNGIDDDCNGVVDDGIAVLPCGSDVGACTAGMRRCVAGTMSCVGAIGPTSEICHNGIDDDCDGQVDEGCICFGAGTSPWHQYLDPHVYCYGQDLDRDMREYSYSSIPPVGDARWNPRSVTTIDFNDPSTIPSHDYCGGTHWGGVFSYFETFIDVPAGVTISSLRVTIAGVDDAVRITLFNTRYPTGYSDASWHSFDSGLNADLASRVASGRNRIVLTHVDDNPATRSLAGVHIVVNGVTSNQCM